MMLGIEFGFSKYYVDNLSENVKRGHRLKVAKGEWPCIAPIGYRNDPGIKRIVVDQDRAPVVRRAFEMYATGTESLDSIRDMFTMHGIRTRTTKLVGRTFVSKLLTNPIYYGHFRWGSEIHEGPELIVP